jgi:putative endonuclease
MTDAWVYMLRCRDGSLYTGWTSDLERRLARHRAGKGSRYTASRLPVELALALPMPDRGVARREEARIKGLDRAGKLAMLAQPASAGSPVPVRGSSSSSTAPSGGSSSPSAGPSPVRPKREGSR